MTRLAPALARLVRLLVGLMRLVGFVRLVRTAASTSELHHRETSDHRTLLFVGLSKSAHVYNQEKIMQRFDGVSVKSRHE